MGINIKKMTINEIYNNIIAKDIFTEDYLSGNSRQTIIQDYFGVGVEVNVKKMKYYNIWEEDVDRYVSERQNMIMFDPETIEVKIAAGIDEETALEFILDFGL